MSVDYPRAWEIARAVEPEYHHNKCSFNTTNGGILCDCDVLNKHPEALDDVLQTKGGKVFTQSPTDSASDERVNERKPNMGCETTRKDADK